MASFVGDWLVSEYVYTPAGEYVGLVHQRRCLRPQAGLIRVVQVCEPVQPAAPLSPQGQATRAIMDRRVGEFVFDLEVVGRARRYHGPDVIGGGLAWAEGALTARGLWPRFGYNFTSFSLLLTPDRQVTGGRFTIANQEAATIVGVAGPATAGFPELAPPTASRLYCGLRSAVTAQGDPLEEVSVTVASLVEDVQRQAPGWQGRCRRYGPLLEAEGVPAAGQTVSLLALADRDSGYLAGLARWYEDETLRRVQVYRLAALAEEARP